MHRVVREALHRARAGNRSPRRASCRSCCTSRTARPAACASTPAPSLTDCGRCPRRPRHGLRAPGSREALRLSRFHGAQARRDSRPARRAAAARAARRQGQLRLGDRRAARRLPACLRLPDHAFDRGGRADGEAPAGSRRRLPPGRQRGRDGQHDVRVRRRGTALHDVHLVARLQPHARRHLLHGGLRGPGRLRQRHAGWSGARKHRPRAGGHQARLPGPRPWQHARHRAGALRRRRRCST